MREHFCSIHPEIFQMYPGYMRGVVIAQDVHNSTSPDSLTDLLRQAEESVRTRLNIETLTREASITSWREAFRKFGAKPGEYRSSIEAMVRRILKGDCLPSINALVDIGNFISLRYLVPVGGHAVDHLNEDLCLRVASGEEEFIPFGTDKPGHPEIGEVIFADGNIVVTRRWTWRQGSHTLVVSGTKAIEYNVDGLLPATPTQLEEACSELVDLVGRFCQGSKQVKILSEAHPRTSLAG
jgi:DNA/RNA-binding domain of Phe-tRNA-synthetase-like protein